MRLEWFILSSIIKKGGKNCIVGRHQSTIASGGTGLKILKRVAFDNIKRFLVRRMALAN